MGIRFSRLLRSIRRSASNTPACHAPVPACRGARLKLEQLEAREVPAINVVLDYSFDSTGMFNDANRRAVLQSAVNEVANNLTANLSAIAPSGSNTWSISFFNPGTGAQTTINNPTLSANTLTIFVGGRAIGGSQAGFGGSGGFAASGSQTWLNTLTSRGPGGSMLWGGSITFDTATNWFFSTNLNGIGSNQVDFYSIAVHELGHVLGIGTSPRWFSQSSGGFFRGPTAQQWYGGPVPLSPDGAHWRDGLTFNGGPVSLDPSIMSGTRVSLTNLDYAALADMGWAVGPPSSPPPAISPPPVSPPPPPPPPSPPVAPVPTNSDLLSVVVPPSGHGNGCDCSNCRLLVITGATDGSAQVFAQAADGTLTAAGPRFQPFPGYAGVIRSVVADFNGDRKVDFAFATGAGTAGRIRIINGATGTDLVASTSVFNGFSGGLFLAAGDVDRDGKFELAVSADVGGGPRVGIMKVVNGALLPAVDFIAFGTPDFRGGSRVAMADINKDGSADLIVGAGIGGGPRVSIYDGTSLLTSQNRLMPDFFALDPNLRSGVFVTAADLNGDGYADLAYSTGNTGGPRVRVVSGYVLVSNPGADVSRLTAMADFFALDQNDRQGLRITAKDLNGDGRAELIVASGAKDLPSLRVIPLGEMHAGLSTPLQNPLGDPTTIDGFYIG